VALENPAEESFELDTTKYKDGAYRVKVEANDAARNPDEPERDDDISQPFFIDNTPPRIEAARVENTPDGPRFLASVTDASSPIAGAVWHTVKAEDKPEAPKPASAKPGASTPKPSTATTTSASASTSAITPSTSAITPTASSAAITPADSTPAASGEGATPKPEDWNALAAQDGLFDSRRENIVGLLVEEAKPEVKAETKPDAKPEAKPAPKPGDRKIEVRAQDAAGNTATVPVTIPAAGAAS
jgi:hypothetical protein